MRPEASPTPLNAARPEVAESALREVCGSERWVGAVAAARPFASAATLLRAAEDAWDALARADWLEAFSAHPRIGEDRRVSGGEASAWARSEQAAMGTAAKTTQEKLAQAQREYEQRFGWPYIVCATGRSAEEMLADCRARMKNDPGDEIAVAAGEERRIGRLRLAKLLAEYTPTGDEA